ADRKAHVDATALPDGLHTYGLTALYTNGRESAPATAEVQIGQSGVDAVGSEGVSVRAEGRTIIVEAPAGSAIRVVSAAGLVLASDESADGGLSMAVAAPGVYLVTVNNSTYKLNIL
ncbi:MAG: hypothetical protein K2M06_03870, partial [Muribaculaceae bacterium]|nr:hypothetical protein [Muribaculaceae bacterium]